MKPVAALLVLFACTLALPVAEARANTPSSPHALYDAGTRAFEAGDLDTAEARFRAAQAAQPNPFTLIAIAAVQSRRGEVTRALATLKQVVLHEPPGSAAAQLAWTRIAALHVERGR